MAWREKGLRDQEALENYRHNFETSMSGGDCRAKIYEQLDVDKAKDFLGLYYVSKAFYPRFPELLSKVLGVGRKPGLIDEKVRVVDGQPVKPLVEKNQVFFAKTLIKAYDPSSTAPQVRTADFASATNNDIVVTFSDNTKERLIAPFYTTWTPS